MASLSSINIIFRVNTRELSTQLQNAVREFERTGKQMQKIGDSLSLYVTAPLLAAGGAAVKSYADMESLSRGLESVMGSAGAAGQELVKLKEVAKLPGLGLEEAVRGSVNLQAAGFSAEQARRTLMAFGNALATVGKGKRELDLVTLALTQMNNKASGFGQDLRQLTEQLPQLRGALKSAFKTADSEEISKMGVTGRQVVEVLTAEFEKLPKVTGGLNNAFENASDTAKVALADIGAAINKSLDVEGKINSVAKVVQGAAESFAALDPELQKIILSMAGVAAAAGPVVSVSGRMLQSFQAITTGGVVTGIIALAAGAALATSRLTPLTNATEEFDKVLQGATQSIAKEKAALDQNIAIAKNNNIERSKREEAMRNINAISPEFLGNLTLENINTKEATKSLDAYNASLLKRAQLTAAQEKLVEVSKKLLDLQMGQSEAVKPSLWQNFANTVKAAGNAQLQAAYGAQSVAENYLEEKSNLEALQKALQGFINDNGQFSESQRDAANATDKLNISLSSTVKSGTIEYYEKLISELEKQRDTTATTSSEVSKYDEKIALLQKRIDALKGKRVVVEVVTKLTSEGSGDVPGVDAPGIQNSDAMQSVKRWNSEIDVLKEVQKAYSETSEEYKALESQIKPREFNIKFKTEGLSAALGPIEMMPQVLNDADTQLLVTQSRMGDFAAYAQEFKAGMAVIMEDLAESFAVGFGEMIGEVAAGANGMQSLWMLMMSTLADMAIQLGKLAIGIGIAVEGIRDALTSLNPVIAVAAGIALIALGTFAKKSMANIAGRYENGGIIGGSSFVGDRLFARVNSGEMILNRKQQENIYSMINPAPTASDLAVQMAGAFRIDGTELRLVLDRADKKLKRNR